VSEIEVYAIGTAVIIDGDIPATIRAFTIYSDTWVKYCCVWWDERTRKEEWLTADEIQFKGNATMGVRLKA
jgi:hypothetical protein